MYVGMFDEESPIPEDGAPNISVKMSASPENKSSQCTGKTANPNLHRI